LWSAGLIDHFLTNALPSIREIEEVFILLLDTKVALNQLNLATDLRNCRIGRIRIKDEYPSVRKKEKPPRKIGEAAGINSWFKSDCGW
jgi:hypothetical protein